MNRDELTLQRMHDGRAAGKRSREEKGHLENYRENSDSDNLNKSDFESDQLI